ncbi:MAG TPA: kelch repeat-containing protein [Gemmatimonadales bacterium]|nr:kelch repeat-containing protein [Gemmatimonadales bacterium]
MSTPTRHVLLLMVAALGCRPTAAIEPNVTRNPTTRLAFVVQPSDAVANRAIRPAIEVAVQDESGHTVDDFAGTVELFLSSNQAGTILSGTTRQVASHGIATFADLSLDHPGAGFTLGARSQELDDVISAPFNALCASNCWTAQAPMPTPRSLFGVGVVNGRVYAVGGRALADNSLVEALEVYDPVTDTWSTLAPLPTPRTGLAVGVANGILYAVGGNRSSVALGVVEAYDPATNTWTSRAPLPTARFGLSVSVVQDQLYAIGGTANNGRDTDVVEAYDPSSDIWTTRTPMPTRRSFFGTAVVTPSDLGTDLTSGVIYAFGGYSSGIPLAVLELYDPVFDNWNTKQMPAMLTARGGVGGASVNGVVFAIGGSRETILTTVEQFDPTTRAWSTSPPLLTGRSFTAIAEVDGLLYAIGGSTVGIAALPTNEAYHP